MRIYRYLFFVLLFGAGIWLSSVEIIQDWEFGMCNSYPRTEFRLTAENRDAMIDKLSELGRKHGVSIFINHNEADKSGNIITACYADDEAKRVIHNDWKYHDCEVRNSLSGRYKYCFSTEPFEKAKGLLYYQTAVYIGDDNSVRALVSELTEYADANLEAGVLGKTNCEVSGKSGVGLKYGFWLWAGIIAVLAVMTVFETAVFRKEAVILLTNGCSLLSIISKRLLTDLAVCSVLLALLSGVLVGIGFPEFALVYAVNAFVILTVLSTLIYLSLYLSNIRAALGGVKQGTKVLAFNYCIKALAISGCIVLSLNAGDIISSNKVGSDTEELIETYFDGYGYANFAEAELINQHGEQETYSSKTVMYSITHDHYYDLKPIQMSHGLYGEDEHDSITANYYAVDYLRSQIPEMSQYDENSRITLILRNGADYADVEEIKSWARSKFSTEKYGDVELQVIYYNDPLELMYIGADTAMGIGYAKDPMITVFNMPPEFSDEVRMPFEFTAIKLDEDIADMLCEEYGLRREDLKEVSVLERYESHWKVIKASILSQIMLAVMTAAVVLLIGVSIVKYTFIARAKELCIRKILGHSLLRRYMWVFVINAVICMTAFIATYFIAGRFYINWSTGLALTVTVGLFIADILLTVPRIIRQEQTSAQKVLKGGAL